MEDKSVEKPEDNKDDHSYREGRRANREGRPNGENPYRIGDKADGSRMLWFVGWYDEKYSHLTGL